MSGNDPDPSIMGTPRQAPEIPIRPPVVRYTDESGIEHEIYTGPDGFDRATDLVNAKDWEALSRYSLYSDMPPLKPRAANVFRYTEDGSGVQRSLFIPPDEVENGRRAYDLYLAKDWKALTDQFEPYADQDRARKEEEGEYSRGIERCARLREGQARQKG